MKEDEEEEEKSHKSERDGGKASRGRTIKCNPRTRIYITLTPPGRKKLSKEDSSQRTDCCEVRALFIAIRDLPLRGALCIKNQ